MRRDVVAFVKVRNDEIGDRQRERLCYIDFSAYSLHFEDEHFFDYIKILQTLERTLTNKDVRYELEIVNENEIAVESFNNKLKDKPIRAFYRNERICILNFMKYLKEKTDDKYLLELMDKFYDQLNHYAKGVNEYYALKRYLDNMIKEKAAETNKSNKSKKR